MKKLLATISVLVLMLGVTACTAPASEDKNLEGEIPDLIKTVIENADINEDFKGMLTSATQTMEITDEFKVHALGADTYEFVEGYFCEPMMSSQAFSLVMLRAKDAASAATLAEEIKTTVDPVKWVCVSVPEEDVQTATIGDMVFLIMAEDSEKFVESFNSLAE